MNQTQLSPRCPIRTTLELLGGKWRLVIINTLNNEQLRLSELKRRIPDISEKMLIQELKTLADHHLVKRINFGEVPPRVEYKLTEVGKTAIPLIDKMGEFGVNYEKTVVNGK